MPIDRAAQLRELYGIEFPGDFFDFWDWHSQLSPELAATFHDDVGMRLVGPFDVLAGSFDDITLRYPAVLHWRYQFDPPEFFTVFSGNTDGLHWGYWFDAPGQMPPCVSAFYASDAFELWFAGHTLFDAVANRIDDVKESLNENIEYDPEFAPSYRESLTAVDKLKSQIPTAGCEVVGIRSPTHETPERMGVVFGQDASEAGEQLLKAKQLWFDGAPSRFESIAKSYDALDRPALAAVARTHGEHPRLPRINILEYHVGDYHSLEEALAEPNEVVRLEVGNAGLETIPDLSSLVNLEELSLWGNSLRDLPPSLGKCSQLRSVNLHRNAFTSVPEVLLRLPQLESLRLGQNDIAMLAPDLTRLERLKQLKQLILSGNPLSESSHVAIRRALPHTEVSF